MGVFDDRDRYVAEADAAYKRLYPNAPDTLEGSSNGPGDAFRHAYVSGRFAQEYSGITASALGSLHEIYSYNIDSNERNMDGENNAKGIEYGERTSTPDELADAVKAGLDSGELVVMEPGTGYYDRKDQSISNDVSANFNSAMSFVPVRCDPLALDLDGDGIETVSANSGITFDFDGDGLKTGTGWVKGDDAFLVLDRNANGTIDTGKELFGVDTVKSNGQKATDGFDALRDLDSNADGVFNAADASHWPTGCGFPSA
jgi:hypothetical protein